MNKRYTVAALLVLCLGLRAWTLEHPDLIDPTEARYAFVAQEMALSGDWTVPKLPWRGEVEPYLGKPPLHFWLTAAAFSVFDMHEWAARLPSFLSLVIMCCALAALRSLEIFKEHYLTASLIMVSSGLLFFMSGASVVDVTLTACTTVAFVTFLLLIEEKISRLFGGVLLFAALGLGFLTKGPVALILVGFPIGLWMILAKRYRVLKQIPWLLGIAVFAAITVPWFLAAEAANPGFCEYFFINENYRRFMFADYGDKYGTGHTYPYGTAWGMLMAGFLPWTIPLLQILLAKHRELFSAGFWKGQPILLFCLLWGLAPVIIFTFAHQLHAAYILPGIPGLALLSAALMSRYPSVVRSTVYVVLGVLLVFVACASFITGLILGTSGWLIFISFLPLLTMGLAIRKLRRARNEIFLAVVTVAAYSLTIASIAETVGERRSTESILRCLTRFSPDVKPHVGVLDFNSYSIYFYSRAWRDELEKPIDVGFLESDKLPSDLPSDLLVRSKDWARLHPLLPAEYKPVVAIKRWTWLRNKIDVEVGTECLSGL